MLMRPGGMLKPAVVGHINEQIRSRTGLRWQNKLPGQFPNRIFETNQRRHPDVAVCQGENGMFRACFEVAWYLIADNTRK